MRFSSTFFALLGLSLGKLASIFPATTSDFEELINSDKFDIRGYVEDSIFLDTHSLTSLPSKFEANWLLETTWKPFSHVVLSGGMNTNEWDNMVKEIEGFQNELTIVHEGESLIVVAIKNQEFNDLTQIISMHRETELVYLPKFSIQPTKTSPRKIIESRIKSLKKKNSINNLINSINQNDLRYFAEFLSGEGNSTDFTTRHSLSQDAVRSGEWAITVFEKYGFVAKQDFFSNYCPNIIAEKKGKTFPDRIVIIGAHLDCRNVNIMDSNGRAPGANDDGSGSAAILQIAKSIFDTRSEFEYTLRLGLWCGEEQGLVGSRAYAKAEDGKGSNIIGMFQADMIGYQANARPQCGFVDRYTEKQLTNYSKEIASIYVPEIQILDVSACCSDHQSFYEVGVPSVGLVEGGGYIIDPKYHNVGDTVNRSGYSLSQMQSIARIMAASAADLAGII